MNFNSQSITRTLLRWPVWILVGVLLAALPDSGRSSATAAPQDDEINLVLQYGPDPEIFKIERLELMVNGWKWQTRLSDREREIVRRSRQQWEEKKESLQEEVARFQKQLGAAGLAWPVDSTSIRRVDDEIRVAESELVALESEMQQMMVSAEAKRHELESMLAAHRSEWEMLKRKLTLVQTELDRTKKLREKDFVPEIEVANVETKLVDLESQLKDREMRIKLLQDQLAKDLSAPLAAVTKQQSMTNDRLALLREQKKVLERMQPVPRINELQAGIDLAQRMIEVALVKEFELELANARNQALIELTEERFQKYREENPDAENAKNSD